MPAYEPSQPILPPRPTDRSVPAQRPRSLLQSWPMLVIILAAIAIVTATVILFLPDGKAGDQRKLMNPPAPGPDRMETNPLPPKQSQIDPWQQPDPGGVPRDPDPDPDPDADPDADPPDDLFGGRGGLGGGGGLGGLGTGGGAFMLAMFDRACAKLKTCPDVDLSMMSSICDQFSAMPKPPPPRCAAGERCLKAIDRLSCSQAGSSNPLQAVYLIQDCMTAMNDC
jgi:hypothetical protein